MDMGEVWRKGEFRVKGCPIGETAERDSFDLGWNCEGLIERVPILESILTNIDKGIGEGKRLIKGCPVIEGIFTNSSKGRGKDKG